MGDARIHLCGRLTAVLDGGRIESELPGRQGRVAFAFLVRHRSRLVTRDELTEVLWATPGGSDRLSPLLSKLRSVVPIEGRREIRLELGDDAWVDIEAAAQGLHRAEGAIARSDWAGAWGPGRVAQHVAGRGFLLGEEAAWIDEERRLLDELYQRSLEAVATACLRIGGGELGTAERTARRLIARSPYSESGHRLLMEALAARGNTAEALIVYDRLRRRLRDELGTVPSAPTQELHRALL